MRLFQFARKVGTTPDTLIKLLAENDFIVENQSNAKLTDEHVALLIQHFTPATDDESSEQEEILTEVSTEVEQEEEKDQIEEEPLAEEEVHQENDLDEESEVTPEETPVEVIRVQKIKLDGPKVLGKIDLPEPIIKEKTEKKEKEPRKRRNWDRKPKARKGPTPEQVRQRELRKKKLERKREEERRKKSRAKFYEENIQLKPEPKKKTKKKKVTTGSNKPNGNSKKVVKDKNPIKRLWAWLNGKYDQY